MKTQGESEAEVSKGLNQIYKGLLGRSTSNIRTNVVGSLVIVVLQNVLTVYEIQAVKNERGRVLVKEMCVAIIENNGPQFIQMIQLATGVQVIDMHHDLSLKTGKEIFVFSLEKEPKYRKKMING
jgi:uncharacterized protein YbcI